MQLLPPTTRNPDPKSQEYCFLFLFSFLPYYFFLSHFLRNVAIHFRNYIVLWGILSQVLQWLMTAAPLEQDRN